MADVFMAHFWAIWILILISPFTAGLGVGLVARAATDLHRKCKCGSVSIFCCKGDKDGGKPCP
jgi:hypothetical protein